MRHTGGSADSSGGGLSTVLAKTRPVVVDLGIAELKSQGLHYGLFAFGHSLLSEPTSFGSKEEMTATQIQNGDGYGAGEWTGNF
jgi:hypothetical protein